VELEFFGAAQEVTGSCHILRVAGRTIMLDCGMFQGRRTESREKNLRLPIAAENIDAVVLSHAHIDHAGRLPLLSASGYTGHVYCTPATRDLCAIMLADSAHIQQKDAEFLARHGKAYAAPLYTQPDVESVMRAMRAVPYEQPFEVTPEVRATLVDAGHILGSASVILECTEDSRHSRLVFSGDVGRKGLPIIRDPAPPNGADAVIMESTYGDREHPRAEDMRERLGAIVRETAARGGRIIIPAFAVGRTQEIVYDLHALARNGGIPAIPIYIDSPLAIDATGVFAMHPDAFDHSEDLVASVNDLFHFNLVHYTRDVTDSKALNTRAGPMIIIAASGMCESGRILHHLLHSAADPRTTILIVGFQAEHTLGRRIVERQPLLRILGEEVSLRARVEILNGYSAHADRRELAAWLTAVRANGPRKLPVSLVHGELPAQTALAAMLGADGYDVRIPLPGDRATL
jgi:metallo-beta-lactamase family protein